MYVRVRNRAKRLMGCAREYVNATGCRIASNGVSGKITRE